MEEAKEIKEEIRPTYMGKMVCGECYREDGEIETGKILECRSFPQLCI